jgi:hypothetical protein
MSDRNENQTLMANNGQMFASGGITALAEGGALPKYKYDPATQTYVLADDDKAKTAMEEELLRQQRAAQAAGGSGSYTPQKTPWDDMTIDQKAAYFAENPREAKIAHTLAGLFKDYTGIGRLVSYFDPIGTGERMASMRGVGLGPDGYMAQQNARAEANSRMPGFSPVWGGGLRDTLGDQPGDYDGQGPNVNTDAVTGYQTGQNGLPSEFGGSATPGSDGPLGGGGYDFSGSTGGGLGGVGGSGTPGSNGPGDGTAADYARGGLAALARGGMSHLGDYSDGGRLLRGPGDGVSDSIPATIGNKRPARLADGEFVVPARIVSELGNGSTEAGARKLYAMMDRIQKGRKKSIGKGRVAVNSRADKNLPA